MTHKTLHRIYTVNFRLLLTFLTLFPMVIYYLKLSLAPQAMATHFILGMPGSIFWGVFVMFWGVLMAIIYVLFRQNLARTVVKKGAHHE